MPTSTRVFGAIKRVVADRGFGFIVGEDGGEYFFHQSDLENVDIRGLELGARVSFMPLSTPKGARAGEVTKVGRG